MASCSSRAKTRSTQSQTCVKYRGINILIKRISDVNIGDLKIFTKCVKIRLIFDTLSSVSRKCYVFCLQLYAWLESCDQEGSFGTKIIRVTHCQSSAMSFIFTQYFFCNSFRHCHLPRLVSVHQQITLTIT